MASMMEQMNGAEMLVVGEEPSKSLAMADAQTTKERYGVKKPIASEAAMSRATASSK